MRHLLVLSPLVLFLQAADAPKPALEVGQAAVDITPKVGPEEKPVWMAGFGKGRKATGVADPLFARAAVLSDGAKKVAVVSVDLVGLFLPSAERVRAALPGFDQVVVSSTHNHEGPDTLGLWGATALESGIDPAYLASAEKRIAEAVRRADKARRPVSAALGTVKAPELLHDSRPPLVLHDDLVAVKFTGADGKAAGMIVQWNCHPETLASENTLLSADYVGYTVKHLEAKHGCPVLYLTGTVGGLMTSLHVEIRSAKGEKLKDGTFEKTARYGELLGLAADKAVASAKEVKLTPFTVKRREVFLPLDNKFFVVARQIGVMDREALLWKADGAHEKVAAFDPKKRHALRTEVSYLQLGDLSVACLPCEIYPELVLDRVAKAEPGVDFPDAAIEPSIYPAMPGPHRMLIGLANDEVGYVLPKRQWDEKPPFSFGLKRAPYGEVNSLGPDTAPLLCEAFAKMVRGK
ncbi:MAG: neutral/alkaline non-lysosomal ceramidase N-terminal domain-containing protein [Gemmataceae bacterium]